MATPLELKNSYRGYPVWFHLFSNYNFLGVYGRGWERLLDDNLEVLGLFGDDQFGEQVYSSVVLPWYVEQLKAIKVINEGFCNMIVLEPWLDICLQLALKQGMSQCNTLSFWL